MAQTSACAWRGACPGLKQRGGTTHLLFFFWRVLDRYTEMFWQGDVICEADGKEDYWLNGDRLKSWVYRCKCFSSDK